MKLTSEHAGKEVIFICNPGRHQDPCHAVIKDVSGPWSNNRVGFCGTEPDYGPMAWCKNPDGGLCRTCGVNVERAPDGSWRVKSSITPTAYNRYSVRPEPCECWDDDD